MENFLAKDIGERIKEIRKTLGLSQEQFSQKLGTSRRSVSKYETGDNALPDQVKLKLYDLGVNPTWLLSGEGSIFVEAKENKSKVLESLRLQIKDIEKKPKTESFLLNMMKDVIDLPIRGQIAAGEPIENHHVEYGSMSFPRALFDKSSEYFSVLQVNGKSMYPKIEHGDYVLIENCSEWEELDKSIVAIRIDNEITLKKLEVLRAGFFILKALNPEYEDFIIDPIERSDVLLIGKLRAILRLL